jgi:hypothetical protein
MKYKVIIMETETGEIVQEMEPTTERMAERIERGANINLNHDSFHTEIVEAKYCPRCNFNTLKHDEVLNPLSRLDNSTYICNDCGMEEAGEDL